MKERPRKTEPPQFLSGWKEIANYLGKGVRTVQRYELQLGLPVRRPAGKPWGSVVATTAELDGWVSASPIREVFRLSRNNNVEKDYAAYADNLKRNLSEMMRLRDQMLALRTEVKNSVQVLRNSVYELQGELNQNRFRDSSILEPSADKAEEAGESFVKDKVDLLTMATEYRKAS
jgi:hypothetical protein